MNEDYRNTERIDYVANLPGARRERDVLVTEVEGEVTVNFVDDINRLLGAVRPADGSVFEVEQTGPIDVSAETVPVDQQGPVNIGQWTAGSLDVTAATVPVESDTPLDVSGETVPVDGTVTVTDDDTTADHPESEVVAHDLVDEDLVIGPVSVARSRAVLVSIHSTDEADWSATLDWQDEDGNTFQMESPDGLTMEQEAWEELTRKATHVEVTVSDESGAESNQINAYVDAH